MNGLQHLPAAAPRMLSLEERIGNLSREASEIHRSLYMVSGFAKEFGIESGELQAVDEIDRSIAEISAKVKDLNERVIGNRIKESRGEVIIKDTKVMKGIESILKSPEEK